MKKIFLSFIFTGFFINYTYAKTYNGFANMADTTIHDNVTVNGSFTGEKLTLKKSLEVNGSGTLKNSKIFGPLHVNGSIDFDNVTVNSQSTINGSIDTNKSSFEKLIALSGDGSFKDSQLTEILVKKPTKEQKNTLYLSGTTCVSGDITFESGKGKVYLSDEAHIKGKVIGGEIIKK
ncbi:MAG: hypothetical protein WA432_01785 [Candidatus Babeliaceae bacterium]